MKYLILSIIHGMNVFPTDLSGMITSIAFDPSLYSVLIVIDVIIVSSILSLPVLILSIKYIDRRSYYARPEDTQ